MTFGKRVFEFYKNLVAPPLPPGIEVMNPHKNPETAKVAKTFLDNYFSDNNKRVLVFGINPGRFGAGITGITFTDPPSLKNHLNIDHNLGYKSELSAQFVYNFIESWGGPKKFYSKFFMTALSPLGFVKNGKNYNYYDDPELLSATLPFIVQTIKQQIELGGETHSAIIFGSGKNLKVFEKLNLENKFFDKVYALEHPRFILQYKRKYVDDYIKKYHEVFSATLK